MDRKRLSSGFKGMLCKSCIQELAVCVHKPRLMATVIISGIFSTGTFVIMGIVILAVMITLCLIPIASGALQHFSYRRVEDSVQALLRSKGQIPGCGCENIRTIQEQVYTCLMGLAGSHSVPILAPQSY